MTQIDEVEIWWLSPKTKRMEMVFGKELDTFTANNLIYKVMNYQDWSELRSLIEKHEDKPISYLVAGQRTQGTKVMLNLTVK